MKLFKMNQMRMHSIAVIEDDLDNLNLNLNEFEVFEHVHLTLE